MSATRKRKVQIGLLALVGAALALAGWAIEDVEARSATGCKGTARNVPGVMAAICSPQGCDPGYVCQVQPMPGVAPKVLPNGKTGYAWACVCMRQNADGSYSLLWDMTGSAATCDAAEWRYQLPSGGTAVGLVSCEGNCPPGKNCTDGPGEIAGQNFFGCDCK